MKKKNLSKLVALAVLLGGVTYSGSVWATEIKIQGDSQPDPSTYSTTTGVGVDATAQNRSLGTNVDKILTASGGVAVAVYGIKTENSYGVTADSISNGIDVKSTSDNAYAISLVGTGTNTISNLGSITAVTTSTTKDKQTAYGIYAKNTNTAGAANPEFSVSFDETNGGSISAYSASGTNYGICFVEDSTGTSEVKNVKSITAGVKSDSTDSSGGSCGIYARDGINTITFSGAGSSVTAKSSGSYAYAIDLYNKGKTTISGLSSITAEGGNGDGCGIMSRGYESSESNVSFVTSGGSITAKASGTNKIARGINVSSKGTTTVSNIGSINVESTVIAYGIYIYGYESSETNVSFVTSGGTINATSTGDNAYGICAIEKGTNTISGLGSITVERTGDTGTNKNAYGIYAKNKNDAGEAADPATYSVSFVDVGGTINAYSASGGNYGIWFSDESTTGTSEVLNVKSITAGVTKDNQGAEVISSGKAYGIHAAAATNTVAFTGAGSSIIAKSSGDDACGVIFYDSRNSKGATGTTTVENLGSITAITSATSKNAYGIYSNGGDTNSANNISFKGNGGQAITATAATAANAYSIYAMGKGATTVNFESSILSGKVYQGNTATLTLNFDNGGVWTPKTGDVTGNVTVNANNGGTIKFAEAYSGGNVSVNVIPGGTIDTRTRDAQGEVTTAAKKTINLGDGTFTAQTGSKISFDAVTADNGFTTDQIKAASATGTIALGSVNVKDEATTPWGTVKKASIFVDGNAQTQTGIAITGTTITQTSNNYLYTFVGSTENGKVEVTSVYANYTLPQIIQGSDAVAKGINAYSLNVDQVLTDDLGTLDNSSRTSGLTIYGNSKTISKGTATNGTVTLAQTMDILTLQGVTVSGFTKFADKAGTLNLSGVTFTGTTGADVITGTGKTVISGLVTADKNIAQQVELQNGANLTATGISVNGTGEVKGIYVNMTNASDTASASVGTITAKTSGSNADAYGILLEGTGTNTISCLGSITAETTSTNKSAYGIYDKSSGESNISFVTSGGTIKATSTTDINSTAYGAQVRVGKMTVSNIKIIEVTSASAAGLYASNNSGKNGSEGNYSFIVTGGDIKVTSTSSVKTSYGVAARTDSKTTVTNLKSIEITGEGTLYGIYSWGDSAENNVSFVTSGGTINATSKAEKAYGISATGNSKMTVKNLGSITVKTTATDKNAYGIYSGDSAENNVSFKGNGGQAITATAATAANAYSIYAKKQGATTVNFENSILSGKVHQEDTATLTLNFNNGGVWTPKDGDVEGTIAVNVNNGGKIVFDLPSNIDKDGTVLQMSGTVTIQDGSTIQVINGKANKLQDDDEICLIDNSANITLETNVVKQHSNNGITWSEAEIYLNQDDNTKLMYKMKKLGLDPDGSKAPVEGMAAAAASVNTSSDLVTGAGMANMITSTAAAGGGAEPFAAASFGSSRLETGSHVDSKGYGIVVGVGKKVFNKAGNKTTGGIFVEYGNSDTDTYNNAVTGSGKSINKGVGYMMRYDHTSGNYYEGMIHAGKINSSWSNSTGGYSMSPTYFGGALTYGHKFMVAEDRQLSVYGSYIYGRTGGGDAKIAGYDYSFGATNSHRTKVGVRYAMSDLMDTKKFRPYIGLAWEREYKGDTVATVRGFGEAPSPSMKGNSGILEIGCKQEVGKWTLGIGAEVFTGKRKGWNGTLQATYNF